MASSDSDKRGHLPARFARHAERLTAGGEHRQPRRGAEEGSDQRCGRVEQMFAVVQHQQHVAVAKVLLQRVDGRPAGLVGQP